jgi:hypothetical protein
MYARRGPASGQVNRTEGVPLPSWSVRPRPLRHGLALVAVAASATLGLAVRPAFGAPTPGPTPAPSAAPTHSGPPPSPAPAPPAGPDHQPDQATPDQATPDQATPDQATPDQATPDQATPDQATPDQPRPKPDPPRSGKARPVPAAKPAPVRARAYPNFYREPIRRGARDGTPHQMHSVRELQYRLRWAGVYRGSVNGFFGPQTERAVKAYQRRIRRPANGLVGVGVWQHLIPETTTALNRVPAFCRKRGWHSCYDRASHQLFTYRDGKLRNVWLVRGGGTEDPTDVGSWKVHARFLRKTSTIYGVSMRYLQKFHGAEGIHGSITMLDPFVGHSRGCVNMYIPDSKVLWDMTLGQAHSVTVYGAWA